MYLKEIFKKDGIDPELLLSGILKDFAYGLKLTEVTEQTVSRVILENPRKWMDRLIKDSWQPGAGGETS